LVLDLGAAQLTVAELKFETDEPLFTRTDAVAIRQVEENTVTERVLQRSTIFRVALEGFPVAENLTLPLDVRVPGRELLVLIENGDSPSLRLKAVYASRRPVYAIFFAPSPVRTGFIPVIRVR